MAATYSSSDDGTSGAAAAVDAVALSVGHVRDDVRRGNARLRSPPPQNLRLESYEFTL
jgi:hypothetical protein